MSDAEQTYQDNLTKYTNALDGLFTDPTSTSGSLVDFILTNGSSPTGSSALALSLASSTWSAINKNPQNVTSILTKVKDALDDKRIEVLTVPGSSEDGEQDPFVGSFRFELGEITRDNLYVPPADQIPEGQENPANVLSSRTPALTSALLQSVAVSIGLVQSGFHVHAVMDGLGVGVYVPEDVEEDVGGREVLVVAALIAFAIVGAKQTAEEVVEMVEECKYEDIIDALKALKEKGAVQNEAAKNLLEATIGKVEKRSEEKIRGEDVVAQLFSL